MSINLRNLAFSPTVNPLLEPQEIQTKRRWVKSGRSEDLVNPATGEISGVAAIHQVEEKDDAEFVKVFAAGVAATYELNKTARSVFQVVLAQYQATPMSRGYADRGAGCWHVRKDLSAWIKNPAGKEIHCTQKPLIVLGESGPVLQGRPRPFHQGISQAQDHNRRRSGRTSAEPFRGVRAVRIRGQRIDFPSQKRAPCPGAHGCIPQMGYFLNQCLLTLIVLAAIIILLIVFSVQRCFGYAPMHYFNPNLETYVKKELVWPRMR